ncbi:MAG: KH domain-containing protein [Bacilli bacterium]|nr:KH domain-containing protein [Bacilli bacterium]MDD3895719.1 KH domain-containing protein [Bacilli bacterium]MDD4407469.1 KH domain-containing protein [Bacilli bacterium]
MELYLYEGKIEKEVLSKALEDLKVTEEEILFKKEVKKGGLFKSESLKFTIVKISDLTNYIKELLTNIFKDIGINVSFETNIRNKQINIKMYSDNNAILIGKNGQTLSALTLIAKQSVFNQIGLYPYINLDVENYKNKQIQHLERLAKNIAREVKNTKTPVIMENMNSYERRIVHSVLTEYKGIKTESEGEEPNRHIIVKPKKD